MAAFVITMGTQRSNYAPMIKFVKVSVVIIKWRAACNRTSITKFLKLIYNGNESVRSHGDNKFINVH